jgi:uncharacterized surface protein with fasciclin (FAS1) repeats
MAFFKFVVVLSSAVATCQSMSIVETAQSDSKFSVLVEALIKADLVTTLSGAGPFTVFAPTNEAFTAALAALGITKEQLLARADLADILKYHVVAGKVPSSALNALQAPETVHGAKVIVTVNDNTVKFGGATVINADLDCSNGVIHVIDSVVLPASMNIVQTAQSVAEFSVLVEAVIKADLVTVLSGDGPFTVFAPTNTAFADALSALGITKAELLARSDLANILKYHVLSGKVASEALKASQMPATVEGQKVTVTKSGATVGYCAGDQTVTCANVIISDLMCKNGVIHAIDKVVLPPAATTTTAPDSEASGAGSQFRLFSFAMSVVLLCAASRMVQV